MILLVTIFLMLCSCQNEITSNPKPRSFPRVIFPEKKYVPFDTSFCAMTFEYPSYAKIEQQTRFFNEDAPHQCWFNIFVPSLGGYIYCSYYPITRQQPLDSLVNDAFVLAGKHNIKANYIEEIPIHKPNNVDGFAFEIDGTVASSFQFYLTDSTRHFMRGALYFNAKANQDSLAPVLDFMKIDIMHMINTFKWKK